METKNIYQRIFEASKGLGHIAKKGHNQMQRYDYVQAADVIAEVRKAAFEHGIMLTPTVTEIADVATFETKSGARQAVVRVKIRLIAINLDDPKDYSVIDTFGDGCDTSDKGVFKAMTGALKYALLYMFMLPTGDDPEFDGDNKKPNDKASVTPPLKKSEVEQKGLPDWTEMVAKKEGICSYCNAEPIKEGSKYMWHSGLRKAQHPECREAEKAINF